MKLYEISNQYQKAFDKLQEMEFDEQTIADSLSLITDDFDKKAINIASYVKNLEADIEAMKNAEKEINARRKLLGNKYDNMRGYLKTHMEKCGGKPIHSPYFDITIKKCPPSVKIDDETKLPDEYIRIKKEPAKDLIKEALNNNIIIEGCSLVKDNTRLEIK